MTELSTVAARRRWQPARAGLIALWRYWDETFVFHRGRLLLRGPNGSGKSMALELLLPFLLDGDTSPARLTSAAKSRGRLFDRVMTGTDDASRTGYAWVEFRRGQDVFTVGARMRASQQTSKVDVDLFTTSQMVGRDLHLLDDTRTPLSKKALAEAIGESGRVHASADEHRAAIREALFPGFDADRYESVISALLALRKEKLSQNLDLEKLSEVLSDALPPIDEHDVAAVAEGFERLDRRRAELDALSREVDEVRGLARRQRDYARAVVVAAADDVRKAETRRDDVTRAERTARESLSAAETEQRDASAERVEVAATVRRATTQIDALKDSDAYREGANLAELRSVAAGARKRADEAAERTHALEARKRRAADEVRDAVDRRETAAANLDVATRALDASAERAGANGAIAEARAIADADDSETFVRAWVKTRRGAVSDVRRALDVHTDAVRRRTDVEEQVAEAEATAERRVAAFREAEVAREAAAESYLSSISDWISECARLGPERVRAVVVPVGADPPAVRAAVTDLVAALREVEARRREQLRTQRAALDTEISALEHERQRWSEPGIAEPAPPPWRSSRAEVAGAPLWRLVDVSPSTPAEVVDGLEAALVATGLVDAWVQPDGQVDLGPGRADIVLRAAPAGSTHTLASVLEPAADAATHGVSADVVAGVLAAVAVADGSETDDAASPQVVVGLDGTFRVGSAYGRAIPRPATLVGAAARERHRLVELARVEQELQRCAAAVADLEASVVALDRDRAAIAAEAASIPTGDALLEAAIAVEAASARSDEARERLADVQDKLRISEQAVRDALRRLTSIAAGQGLPADAAALDDVEEALARLAESAGVWARRRREVAAAESQIGRVTRALDEVVQDLADAVVRHDAASRDAERAEQRVATLEAAIGADYGDVVRQIGDLERSRDEAAERVERLEAMLLELAGRVAKLEEKVASATRDRELADEHRTCTQRRFVGAVDALGSDADVRVDEGWSASASEVLASARAVFAAHESLPIDEAAIERLSERVNERLHQARTALGSRIDLDRELADLGWWVLRTSTGGVRRTVTELAAALSRELDEGRRELDAEEERLFEQTLAGSVRRALADRIRQASALVDGINGQLAAVKTAAGGVEVRLRWEVDPDQPAAVRAARALLLRDPADLSDEERRSLQEFVRARVDQARAELEANAPWEARLRETLDYRAWHRFSLQLAHRDWEGFKPATPRLLQRLSTGERSIALHLPMIASVAAHYEGDGEAASECPRLILLDELFAGVDAANRAQLFGTFTTWDLDAVFTSDHEWCQYATLDGIAIHHLHPPTGAEPATSTRFTWDGRRRLAEPAA